MRLPYYLGNQVADADTLVVRSPTEFAAKQAIKARVHHEVTELDLDRRAVRVRDAHGGTETWEGFDALMVATGATPRRPDLPGIDATGIFGVQTLDDGLAVRAFLQQRWPRQAAVVGAGYVGLELAEALCGCVCTSLSSSPDPPRCPRWVPTSATCSPRPCAPSG